MATTLSEDVVSSPGSPPGMTASKSSKSSSFHSLHSDDNSILGDACHFEDIGLDDGDAAAAMAAMAATTTRGRPGAAFRKSWSPDPRSEKQQQQQAAAARPVSFARPSPARTLSGNHERSGGASAHLRVNTGVSLAVAGMEPRGLISRSTGSLPMGPPPRGSRSPSPTLSVASTGGVISSSLNRRASWQSAVTRKSIAELERECDDDDKDDDGDDIPPHLVLDNVPISPRPLNERESRPDSPSPSERTKPVGNGTPAVAQARGSLRSPDRKASPSTEGDCRQPKARTKSWTAAMAALSAEARALTAALEEHASQMEKTEKGQQQQQREQHQRRRRRSTEGPKCAALDGMPALPPVQKSIMIDPLPTSREKEAVLSRTRPSWLPPKDPAEERRHLREYRRMMTRCAEAERKREVARAAQTASRDSAAGDLMRVWEQEILPRWDDAMREDRTREMWWRGVPPRSRGTVWARAIGNPLELTETSYEAALSRAHQVEARVQGGRCDDGDGGRAAWFGAIRRDVSENTWADLRIFQPSGPLHQALVDVLCAYAMYRSDIGYVPGCHTLAALLLLNLPSAAATFIALANVLNRPMPLGFYSSDPAAKSAAYGLAMRALGRKSTALHNHLTQTLAGVVDPDEYLGRVFRSLFTSHLGIDEAARLWDVYVFEGDVVLVNGAVALLLEREMALLGTRTAAEVREVLGRGGGGSRKRAVGESGSEKRWIEAVREAGR